MPFAGRVAALICCMSRNPARQRWLMADFRKIERFFGAGLFRARSIADQEDGILAIEPSESARSRRASRA